VGFSHAHYGDHRLRAVVTTTQPSFGVEGRTHGQKSTVRGYPLLCQISRQAEFAIMMKPAILKHGYHA
jgi:hypothetical protein